MLDIARKPSPETFGFPSTWLLEVLEVVDLETCAPCYQALGISKRIILYPPERSWSVVLVGEGYIALLSNKESTYKPLVARRGIELIEPPLATTPCLMPGFEGTEHRIYDWRWQDESGEIE